VIGPEHTASPVDLDQVLNSFTPRTRTGLSNFIKGQAAIYAGKGEQANRSYKYLQPAVWTTNEVLDQLNRDDYQFQRFVTSSARLFTTLASRRDQLSASISNANQAFAAIAGENRNLSETLVRLPPTFRRSNTAFVNLRSALGDLDSLVDTAKPATANLTPFLKNARPVVSDAVPFFRNLHLTLRAPGKANDLAELTSVLPSVGAAAHTDFADANQALNDFQPTLEFARPYAPEMIEGLAKLGQDSAYYDADGHYFRALVSGLNIFRYNSGTNALEPAPAADQYAQYGSTGVSKRCPGGVIEPAPDNSNPFFDPPWPASGLTGSECDVSNIPPGP
jgi:phospholipid/cholesterol/gamma-HCH transport system substrate-binding protein